MPLVSSQCSARRKLLRFRCGTTLPLFAALLGLAGCGGGGGGAAVNLTPPPPPSASVTVAASNPSLEMGQTTTITAAVANDTSGAGVTFQLAPGDPGTLTTTDKLHAIYTAPTTISAVGTVTVVATSVASTTAGNGVAIQLVPVAVAVTSDMSSMDGGQLANLTATVSGDPNTTGVIWTLPAGAPGTLTTVDSLHATSAAPALVSASAAIPVTAASVSNPHVTAQASINLQAIAVGASAASATVYAGQTTTLTAVVTNDAAGGGVTWTLAAGAPGTLTVVDGLHATYSAPSPVRADATVVVTAASATNSGVSSQVSLNLASVQVTVAATPAGLAGGQTAALKATVNFDTAAAGVTWSLAAGAAGTLTTVDSFNATYTAPATVPAAATAKVVATSVTDPSQSSSTNLNLLPVQISLAAAPFADVHAGQTAAITATVANDPQNGGVTFATASGAAGTLTMVDGLHATYTAPATVSSASSLTLTATSVSNASQSATLNLQLLPPLTITDTLTGTSTALGPLQDTTFTAAFTNDPTGAGVSATFAGPESGDNGTVSALDNCAAGVCTLLYTAPPDVAKSGTVTITTAAVADPSKTATVVVSLQAPAVPAWDERVQFERDEASKITKPWPILTRVQGTSVFPGIYQPEMLIFRDIPSVASSIGVPEAAGVPGTEVWLMDNDQSDTQLPNVARSPWTADGSHLILESDRNGSQSQYGWDSDFIYNARGGNQFPLLAYDPSRPSGQQYVGLDNTYTPPDRLQGNIVFTLTATDDAFDPSTLYSLDLSSATAANGYHYTATKILALPNPSLQKVIYSQVAEDDVLMVEDVNASESPATPGCTATGTPACYFPELYMVDVNPNHPTTYGTILHQFSIGFNIASLPCLPGEASLPDSNGVYAVPTCHDPGQEWHLHDIDFSRNSNDDFVLNYGPRGSPGEQVDFDIPFLGGGTQLLYPLGTTPYYSHPGYNFGNTAVVYEGEEVLGDGNFGLQLRNLSTGQWVRSYGLFPFESGHSDWEGYDPNFFAADGWLNDQTAVSGTVCNPQVLGGAAGCGVGQYDLYEGAALQPYPDGSYIRRVMKYPYRNPATSPLIYDSPTQSPDATKIAVGLPEGFATTGPCPPQPTGNANIACQRIYIAVAHAPVAPTLAVTSTNPVTLTWTKYVTHRETALYHIYRSSTGPTAGFQEIAAPADNGLSNNTQAYTDTSAVAGTTYYYALTSEERSGLESQQLSNVMAVVAGGASSQAAAAGLSGWDTTPPAPPTQVTISQPDTNNFSAWKISWTPSTSAEVRYYNIYYGEGMAPVSAATGLPEQQYRVDSPPLGETSYIFWQAAPAYPPVLGVTAVDRQGNESAMVCVAPSSSHASLSACPTQ